MNLHQWPSDSRLTVARGPKTDTINRNSLVEQHLPIARRAARWAKRRAPPKVEFDDLFQTAAVALVEAATHYDRSRGTPFEEFAAKRVYGAAIELFRRWRYNDYITRSLDLPGTDPLEFPVLDDQIAAREICDLVHRLLPALTELERTLIVLHYWQGMNVKDIAAQLRICQGRAYQVHVHALEELRRELRRRIHIVSEDSRSIQDLLSH